MKLWILQVIALVGMMANSAYAEVKQDNLVLPFVSIVVDPGSSTPVSYSAPWTIDTTVLSAMQSSAGLKFTAEWYHSFNDWLVVSINGQEKSATENWLFCVNGQPAQVGIAASRLPIQAEVKWVYTADYPPSC